MALFYNGFDFFNTTAALALIWDSNSAGNNYTTGAFNYGAACVIGGSPALNKTFANIPNGGTGQWATFYCGFHYKPNAAGSVGDGSSNWITFYDGATVQAVLRIDTSGYIKLYRGNGTALLGTSSSPLTPSIYQYIAFKIVFSATVGTFDLQIGGSSVLSLTGLNNISTANAYSTKIQFTRAGNGTSYEAPIDNVHMYDGTDPAPFNAILPESKGRVYFFLPNGDGALTGWTASAGSKYQCIDENPPNTTDYIYEATVGVQYSATKAAVSNIASIQAAQAWGYVAKDDATIRGIKLLSRSSGGAINKSAELLLSSTYQYALYQMLVDPSTSAAWTVANFDSNQFGIEVTT